MQNAPTGCDRRALGLQTKQDVFHGFYLYPAYRPNTRPIRKNFPLKTFQPFILCRNSLSLSQLRLNGFASKPLTTLHHSRRHTPYRLPCTVCLFTTPSSRSCLPSRAIVTPCNAFGDSRLRISKISLADSHSCCPPPASNDLWKASARGDSR